MNKRTLALLKRAKRAKEAQDKQKLMVGLRDLDHHIERMLEMGDWEEAMQYTSYILSGLQELAPSLPELKRAIPLAKKELQGLKAVVAAIERLGGEMDQVQTIVNKAIKDLRQQGS